MREQQITLKPGRFAHLWEIVVWVTYPLRDKVLVPWSHVADPLWWGFGEWEDIIYKRMGKSSEYIGISRR